MLEIEIPIVIRCKLCENHMTVCRPSQPLKEGFIFEVYPCLHCNTAMPATLRKVLECYGECKRR